ncbi:MAG TPA: FAD/NAD(P)-binding oxidoreductase [Halanaerobiales bacterium]|nr:FAD/NAD(P)-binding oxidoreductase [Halanaerobiales bacterium]
MKYLIVGSGPAGMNAAYKLNEIDKDADITIINGEPNPPYSRILTTFYLEGKIEEEDFYIYSKDFLEQDNIHYYENTRATSILPEKKLVELNTDELIKYDKLLIASGGDPNIPSAEGINSEKVYKIRTLEDIKDIKNEVKKSKTCAILGGGLVSLKMTQALSKKGIDIKILIRSPRVLSQVLDDETAYLVQKHLKNNNVDVKVNTEVLEIQEKDNKLLFVVKSGQKTEEFEADFAVIGKGVKPNIDFLEDTSIETDWGILTDEYLQTKEKDVYAVGDVAESYNIALDKTQLNSIWPDAVLQGIKAAENMAGKTKPYVGNINMNAVDIFSLPLVAMGRVRDTENIEILRSINIEEDKFLKLFFKDRTLVGAILIGEIENAGIYKQLIINRKKIHDSHSLLNQKNMLANYIF